MRKQLLPTQIVEFARALRPKLKAEAQDRQRRGRAGKGAARGSALDIIAELAGVSRKTLMHAEKVVEAGERDPKRFGVLVREMDATGKIDGAYRKFVAMTANAQSLRSRLAAIDRQIARLRAERAAVRSSLRLASGKSR